MNCEITDMPSEFMSEETRCGFKIDINRKRVWKVELDILAIILRICEEAHIKCFAIAGTLLGALRHKGMIPWDDDIDLGMLRVDYNRFLAVAPKMLPRGCFLQTMETDRCWSLAFAKVRDSRTTALEGIYADVKHLEMNHGMFVDIFPVDMIDDDPVRHARNMRMAGFYQKVLDDFTCYQNGGCLWLRRTIRSLLRVMGRRWVFQRMEAAYGAAPNCYAKKCGLLSLDHTIKRFQWDSSIFGRECIKVPFEYLELPILPDYDSLLTTMYGDWRTPVQGGACHSDIQFWPDRPYAEVIREVIRV